MHLSLHQITRVPSQTRTPSATLSAAASCWNFWTLLLVPGTHLVNLLRTHAVNYGTHLLHAQLKFSRSKLSTAHLSAAVSLFRPTHTDSSSPNIFACFDENKTEQNMAITFLERGALKDCFIATWIKSKQLFMGVIIFAGFLLCFATFHKKGGVASTTQN